MSRPFGLVLLAMLAAGCREQPSPVPLGSASQPASTEPTPEPKSASDDDDTTETGETGDPLSGEAAHTIPFADRSSMGYLLLLPAGTKNFEAPSRAYLQTLVEQAFPDRRTAGEFDLLLTLISTSPHETGFDGELMPPSLGFDESGGGGDGGGDGGNDDHSEKPKKLSEAELAAAKAERSRTFDVIGLHIETLHLGIGETTTIPTSALTDPVLTRDLDEEQRKSLLGREWALLLRADYRNQHAVRGLRLHQTLVRVVAGTLRGSHPRSRHARDHGPRRVHRTPLASRGRQRRRSDRDRPVQDSRDDKFLRMSQPRHAALRRRRHRGSTDSSGIRRSCSKRPT